MSDYYNDAGEPLMDGTAMLREMSIDADPLTYYCDDCGVSHIGPCADDDYDDD